MPRISITLTCAISTPLRPHIPTTSSTTRICGRAELRCRHTAILSFHKGGWFIDLNGNYYDRIYLSYAPSRRYGQTLVNAGDVDNDGNYVVPAQAKGKGGFMLDGSIGKSIYLEDGKFCPST